MIRFGIELRALCTATLFLLVTGCGKPAPSPGIEAAAPEPAATPAPVAASTDDPADLMDAKVIHWSVVGDYAGEDLILNVGTSGYAPVTDHVEIGFDYTLQGNGGMVGTPTFTDQPSQMGALRNGAKGCRAPVVSGKYEHSSIESLADGLGGQLAMMVRTDYPAGSVPVACTGGNQASPAHSSTTQVELLVPGIALLSMGDQLPAGDITVSQDKRSITVKQHGWTYTYTPTKAR